MSVLSRNCWELCGLTIDFSVISREHWHHFHVFPESDITQLAQWGLFCLCFSPATPASWQQNVSCHSRRPDNHDTVPAQPYLPCVFGWGERSTLASVQHLALYWWWILSYVSCCYGPSPGSFSPRRNSEFKGFWWPLAPLDSSVLLSFLYSLRSCRSSFTNDKLLLGATPASRVPCACCKNRFVRWN